MRRSVIRGVAITLFTAGAAWLARAAWDAVSAWSETRAVGRTITLGPYLPRILLGIASFALAALTLGATVRLSAASEAGAADGS